MQRGEKGFVLIHLVPHVQKYVSTDINDYH